MIAAGGRQATYDTDHGDDDDHDDDNHNRGHHLFAVARVRLMKRLVDSLAAAHAFSNKQRSRKAKAEARRERPFASGQVSTLESSQDVVSVYPWLCLCAVSANVDLCKMCELGLGVEPNGAMSYSGHVFCCSTPPFGFFFAGAVGVRKQRTRF